ncbi:uncharacterized protein L201_003957 [Kwoniella dendrophila CBS 6074]|uniref:Uncharacterized protein n=1 Tax=Kwoniella dendrophila CBS 6074 TaxID=1295534 RepID=A0AAX4JUK3_9TREE
MDYDKNYDYTCEPVASNSGQRSLGNQKKLRTVLWGSISISVLMGFFSQRSLGNQKKLRTVLWGSISISVLMGSISLTVGVLGVLTFYEMGPLFKLVIPISDLDGTIVNISTLASLITAITTILAAIAKKVYSDLSRSWLLRRAIKKDGITIKRWRAAASGGGIIHIGKSPFMTGGIALGLAISLGLMSSSFSGILVPNLKENYISGEFNYRVPGYSGNSGIGYLISCLNTTEQVSCPPSIAYSSVFEAIAGRGLFTVPPQTLGLDQNSLSAVTVFPGENYYAGLIDLELFLVIRPPEESHNIEINSVGLQTSATCQLNPNVGVNVTGGYYYYLSPCSNEYSKIGNSSNNDERYSTGGGCSHDTYYTIEYAVVVPHKGTNYNQTTPTKPFAFTCSVTANEGVIRTQIGDGTSRFDKFISGNQLTGEEVETFASAVVAVLLQDSAILGKTGELGERFEYISHLPDKMDRVSKMISNGAAAAATVGYLYLGFIPFFYKNRHSGNYSYYLTSYGWVGHKSTLAWSVIALLSGLVWLVAAIYMLKGGTNYDPTDWFHTLNTGAGSTIQQIPGTSSCAGLEGKRVNTILLWYGAISPERVGFSERPPIFSVDPNEVYQ